MLDVSTQWQNASMMQFRYQAYLKCSISVVPPGLMESVAPESSDTFSQSDIGVIVDRHTSSPEPLATLEHNRWLLSGIFDFLEPEGTTDDWWSNGTGTSEVVFQFDTVYTIPGMYIEWDLVNDTFPAKIMLIGYNASGVAVASYEIVNINSSAGYVEAPMDNVQKVVLQILSWNAPTWRARINSVVFGFTSKMDSINNGRITYAYTANSSKLLSDELPKHALSITLRNYDLFLDPTRQTGLAKYLTERQVAQVQWGFRTDAETLEWSKPLTYLVSSISVPSETREAELQFASRLDFLTDTFTLGTYTATNRTFYEIAEYILQHSGLLKTMPTETPWVLPDVLKQYVTSAPIAAQTTNALLQLIAGATNTMLTTRATDGFVEFKQAYTTPSEYCSIGQMQSTGDPTIEVAQPLKSISVGLYSYSTESTTKEIGKFEAVVTGTQTLLLEYNVDYARDVAAAITGATISQQEFYASYAVLTVVGTGETASITLTGKEVKGNVTYITTYTDANVANGLNIKVDNPFITNVVTMQLVSNAVQNYYKLRNQTQVNYLGYPQLEPGDCIKLSSVYEEDQTVVVEENNITFNGGWSGAVKVV